jgi:hypothetical protein
LLAIQGGFWCIVRGFHGGEDKSWLAEILRHRETMELCKP